MKTLAFADRLHIGGRRADLQAHLATHGPLSVRRGDPRWGTEVHRAVAMSGLLGRGGAGFPSGAKWEAHRRASRRPVVVVNALEGEPASAKDGVLLTCCPHLVLDGAEVLAAVLGASAVVVCVADHLDHVAASVEMAIEERRRAGLAQSPVSVRRPPGRYVAGEESALNDWLKGGPGLPAMRVDKSVPLRLGRHEVLVHNVETMAQVALVARHGPEWFRQLGTPDAAGSTLVTVTGGVDGPVVFEVGLGTTVAEIMVRGGVDGPLSAVLLGGYAGAWCEASRLDTPFAPGPLASVGASLGVGVVVGLPASACGVAETARIARFLAGESAGQCGPCVFGLPAIADDLERLAAGRADPEVLDRIAQRAAMVDGRGACRHPDGLVRLVRSSLRVFAEDAWSHALGRPCPGHAAPTALPFPAGTLVPGRAS